MPSRATKNWRRRSSATTARPRSTPKTRALLDYAVTVTRDVHQVSEQTIAGLRAAGWSDEDILTATHIICLFNYYTRLADALGVEPEDFMQQPQVAGDQ